VPAWAGNAIGFFASAQLNFALSSVVTWGDRPARRGRTVLRRWASYQGSTLLVLCANVAVFTVVSPYVWHIIAAGVGVVVGSGCSYAINHLLIFRGSRPVGEVAG
jgi:putative flippase GtrA